MSKNMKKRIEGLEQKRCPDKTVVLKMWLPKGKTTRPNQGRVRIEPLNPEDAEI
jgi:hypothetical protein